MQSSPMIGFSRRRWLQQAGFAASALTLPGFGLADAHAGKRRVERIGVQLYTLRAAMAKDAAATLAAVAAAGYAEVETAGTGSLTPAEFALALKRTGLTAPAAHVPINLVVDDPDSLLTLAQAVGHRYLVVPWIPPEMRTASGYAQLINALNTFGEQCAGEGLQLCYHNHDFEFERVDGEVAFDRLLRECDNDTVRFELDLFWVAHAGADGGAYLSASPERYPLCHVKDRDAEGNMVDVGQGEIDFPALFAAGSGLQHYFVEHDRPTDALASVIGSLQAVKDMRF